MINTHSSFLFDFEVTPENKYIDFVESGETLVAEVETGSYSLEELLTEIQTALNETGILSYTVSVNRATRIVTISSDSAFDLLVSSGDNADNSIYSLIGIPVVADFTAVTSVSGTTAVGTLYRTQFKLQDFVHCDDLQMQRFPTVSKSASGRTTMVSFGVDRFFEFSFKWITDLNIDFIRNVSSKADFNTLLRHMSQKRAVEFYPDEADTSTFYTIILESSPDAGDWTGYKLQEQYTRGLIGFYEFGPARFRVLEE